MRASTRSPRGFTLIELLIAALATAVLVLGAASLLVAQQTTFRHTSSERAMNETGRIGLEHIARNLRAAGFGVDPGLVFDLGAQASARMDLPRLHDCRLLPRPDRRARRTGVPLP
jgi:prepilin-type N-terminal cleavage/methylation domain-containing protein